MYTDTGICIIEFLSPCSPESDSDNDLEIQSAIEASLQHQRYVGMCMCIKLGSLCIVHVAIRVYTHVVTILRCQVKM